VVEWNVRRREVGSEAAGRNVCSFVFSAFVAPDRFDMLVTPPELILTSDTCIHIA